MPKKPSLSSVHNSMNKNDKEDKAEKPSTLNGNVPRGERSEFLRVTMTMPMDLWVKLKEVGMKRKANKEKDYDISSLLRESATYWLDNIS